MIDIEQQAINTFQKNYAYFSSNHPQLYQKINILQSAIESQQYQENYSLEYINGAFDIKELGSGQFLYDSSSIEHAEATAKNVNLKKNESVIETFYNFPYTQTNIDDLDKLTIINSHMTGTAPIVRFMNEHTSNSDEMKKIFKFIFFGVGVGEHLTSVNQKISADSYFVIEDNLELFRLSMFVTDYEALGKKARLFFSVMDTPGEFKHTYNLFAEDMLIRNSHLKFYLLSDSYASKIKQIQNFAMTKSHLIYPYNYLLHKNLLASQAIHENYNFLNISKSFESSPFSEKPLLYLAAGPSLNAHIDWIKEHQESFVVVAVFMITAKLEKAGICPDIVVHVDEAKEPVEATLAKMISKDFLKESAFILATSVSLELFTSISNKEKVFLIEDRTHYKKDHGFLEFFSVGEVGYALSLIFGAKDIYLLGLDLALDQKTGKTHAEGHSTLDEVDIEKGDNGPESMASLREMLIKVRGNKQEYVFTTPLFDASIHQLNRFSKMYKQSSQNVYNLSDGAYFDESVAVEINTVQANLLDKDAVRQILYDYLKNKSTDHLSAIEKNNIIIRKNEVKRKSKLIERFSKQNIKNQEEFRKQLIGLIGSLITPVSQELNEVSEIFLNYFQTVGNYIGNFLNTETTNDSDPLVKELQKILSRQLYKILHDIGSFKFNYINGKKYFDVGEGSTFKNKILDLRIRASDISQIDQINFIEKLDSQVIDMDKLKGVYSKNAIGFLAIEENLEDTEYIKCLDELMSQFPDSEFKAFYFDEGIVKKVKQLFIGHEVKCVLLDNVYTIHKNIEVYLSNNFRSLSDTKILFTLREISTDLFCLGLELDQSDMSIKEYEEINQIYFKKFFDNLEVLGFHTDDIQTYGNTFHEIFFKKASVTYGVSIDFDMNTPLHKAYIYWNIRLGFSNHNFFKYSSDFAKKFARVQHDG